MTMWYVNRAAGLVAWTLLAASMILGLLLSSKALGKAVKPNWLQDLHRGLSGLSVIFVIVHVAGAVGDNFLHFGVAEVLVPFASAWRPWAIAWGVVTGYLLIAVEGTSLLRKHIPKATWRKVHYLSFPLFLTATAHGITAGTEGGTMWAIALAAIVTAVIAVLTTMRVLDEIDKSKAPAPSRIAAPTAAPASAPWPATNGYAQPTNGYAQPTNGYGQQPARTQAEYEAQLRAYHEAQAQYEAQVRYEAELRAYHQAKAEYEAQYGAPR